MKHGSRYAEELVVLSDEPRDTSTILNWRPYGSGNTLGEIVTAHNLRSQASFMQSVPGLAVDCIKSVLPILCTAALTTADLDSLKDERLERIKIILLDLDNVDSQADRLVKFSRRFSDQQRILHLLLIGRTGSASSYVEAFKDSPYVHLAGARICRQQSQLEACLRAFYQTFGRAWVGVVRNPFDTLCPDNVISEPYIHPRHRHFIYPRCRQSRAVGRACQAYQTARPAIVADVRDVALAKSLSAEQTMTLGRSAAIQEFLLALVTERVRPGPGYPASVRDIRLSLFDMEVDTSFDLRNVQRTSLLQLHLAQSRRRPTQDQCDTLAELGFSQGVLAVVHSDSPEVRALAERLEDLITIRAFDADLPNWRAKTRPTSMGLNEISLGLRIEESFARNLYNPEQ